MPRALKPLTADDVRALTVILDAVTNESDISTRVAGSTFQGIAREIAQDHGTEDIRHASLRVQVACPGYGSADQYWNIGGLMQDVKEGLVTIR